MEDEKNGTVKKMEDVQRVRKRKLKKLSALGCQASLAKAEVKATQCFSQPLPKSEEIMEDKHTGSANNMVISDGFMKDECISQEIHRDEVKVRRRGKMPSINQLPPLQCKMCMRSFRRPGHLANHLKACDALPQGTQKDEHKEWIEEAKKSRQD